MQDVLIEVGVKLLFALIVATVEVLAYYVMRLLNETKAGKEMRNTTEAMNALFSLVQITCAELQQTLVDNLKSAHEDGKLDRDDIAHIQDVLITKVDEKMSQQMFATLHAAGSDLEALILGMAEAWVQAQKKEAA